MGCTERALRPGELVVCRTHHAEHVELVDDARGEHPAKPARYEQVRLYPQGVRNHDPGGAEFPRGVLLREVHVGHRELRSRPRGRTRVRFVR